MERHDWLDIIGIAVKAKGKRAVYLNNDLKYTDDEKAIWEFVVSKIKEIYPEDGLSIISDIICDTKLFLFDTEEEQYKFYRIFEHELTYASPIFAMTLDEKGCAEASNT
jgi:hypothetical protein